MKPLKLTLSAFNAFADTQTIDFSDLGGSGLYLITGETGSGKTTIFDAVSFALFGKASGSGRDDYAMLRSDFADGKIKTYVELDFMSGSSLYNIKRTIKRIGQDKTAQDVVLTLPDGTTLSGDRNIKPKIIEIVGLDRDQFTQIVMIAQNDFLRFLQSGTDERVKILRRIFGTEKMKTFQERLKALAKAECEKRDLIIHDFSRYGIDVYKRDDHFAQWETQVAACKTELTNLDHQLNEWDKTKQTLAADLALAEDLSRKFADLLALHTSLETHRNKTGHMAAVRERAARGEAALRKVKPLADEAAKATVHHRTSQANLTAAREQENAAQTELEQVTQEIRALPSLAEAQAALALLIKNWTGATENLKKLKTLQINRADIVNKQATLAKERTELAAALQTLAELPPLANSQAELDQVTQALSNSRDNLTKLTSLQSDLSVITEKQQRLAAAQTEFAALSTAFTVANNEYMAIEEAFLRGQAGILAGGLTPGEPCPVCGSTAHPAPASIAKNDITEAKLKKARAAKEQAQTQREHKSTECGRLKAETETLINRFHDDLSTHLAAQKTGPAAPVTGQFVLKPDQIALLAETLHATKAAVAELTAKKTTAEKTLEETKAKSARAAQQRDKLTPIVSSLQGTIDTLTERFHRDYSEMSAVTTSMPNDAWASSETTLAELLERTQKEADALTLRKGTDEKTLSDLTTAWETATKRRAGADTAYKTAQTLVAERAAHERALSDQRDRAQTQFQDALLANGFAGDADSFTEPPGSEPRTPNPDYAAALINEDELTRLTKQIADYEKTGDQLTRDINRLETETAGKNQPDLVKLKTAAETADSTSIALSHKRDETRNILEKTESALKDLRRSAVEFAKAEKNYAAVKQLSDTANGKLDFETYTQSAYFERVLHAANIRLKLMSQSRYTLQRKAEYTDKRTKTGLEIEVMDAYTGKARSANSLSGGESFMASLSLALGLSDIVQQNAGGVHLDAMFIDEGFGSLDTEILDLAVRTLSELAGANRIIGIISHVAELRERIDKQIRVEKTTGGSQVTLVV